MKTFQESDSCLDCSSGVATALSRSLRFLRRAAILSASGIVLLSPHAWAARSLDTDSKRRLIVVFLRGAVDGLKRGGAAWRAGLLRRATDNCDWTHRRERGRHRSRRAFRIASALAPMESQWRDGTLAFVHACGSPNPTRFAFRRAGFHGERYPRNQIDAGWMAQSDGSPRFRGRMARPRR